MVSLIHEALKTQTHRSKVQECLSEAGLRQRLQRKGQIGTYKSKDTKLELAEMSS